MKKQREIPIGKFKDSCLRLLDEVHKHGIPLTITRRGKPIARVVPLKEGGPPGSLLGTVTHEAADLFSTGEEWEAEA
jgi:prevent-host-death family protein